MIAIRSTLQPSKDKEVLCFLRDDYLSESDKKEFIAYQNTEQERSSNEKVELFDDLVFKSNFIKIFKELLISRLELCGTEKILEMGAGQAWASVLVKSKYPNSYVVASDLVPVSLNFCLHYEKFLNVYIDEKWAFNCRDIPFEDGQFDRIFTFAAFHHFGESNDYSKVINEMVRILKPKGKIVLLYEPSSPKYLYNLAFKRVNARRDLDGVDEDVLVISKLEKHVNSIHCKFKAEIFPEYLYREGIASTIYYYVLSKLGVLKNLFLSTVNIVIEKS
jgi:ubiquinone/menaquinone biosynthesis C-methylase UbiE